MRVGSNLPPGTLFSVWTAELSGPVASRGELLVWHQADASAKDYRRALWTSVPFTSSSQNSSTWYLAFTNTGTTPITITELELELYGAGALDPPPRFFKSIKSETPGHHYENRATLPVAVRGPVALYDPESNVGYLVGGAGPTGSATGAVWKVDFSQGRSPVVTEVGGTGAALLRRALGVDVTNMSGVWDGAAGASRGEGGRAFLFFGKKSDGSLYENITMLEPSTGRVETLAAGSVEHLNHTFESPTSPDGRTGGSYRTVLTVPADAVSRASWNVSGFVEDVSDAGKGRDAPTQAQTDGFSIVAGSHRAYLGPGDVSDNFTFRATAGEWIAVGVTGDPGFLARATIWGRDSTGQPFALQSSPFLDGNTYWTGAIAPVTGTYQIDVRRAPDQTKLFPTGRDATAAVWTGRHAYVFGGYTGSAKNEIFRHDLAADAFTKMGATLPTAAYGMSAVWTGQYVYLFGGCATPCPSAQILRYDPATDTIATMTATLPAASSFTSAVWTGTHAYVFGTGAASTGIFRYDPATDTVVARSAVLPSSRSASSAVWSGTFAYVFGGGPSAQILRYDSSTDTLIVLPQTLPEPLTGTSAAWNGTAAFILGGYTGSLWRASIITFTPSTGEVATSTVPLPGHRTRTSAVWDGTGVIVFGGYSGTSYVNEVVRYEPGLDPPLASTMVRLPSGLTGGAAVGGGSEGYVFGAGPDPLRFNVTTNAVSVATTADAAPYHASGVWTGSAAYLFGGETTVWVKCGQGAGYNAWRSYAVSSDAVTRFVPATGAVTASAPLPETRLGTSAVWVDGVAYLFGGRKQQSGGCVITRHTDPPPPMNSNEILRFDPVTNSFTTVLGRLPTATYHTSAVWDPVNRVAYVFGGCTDALCPMRDIVRFDPVTQTATLLPTQLPFGRQETAAVWDPVRNVAYVIGGANFASSGVLTPTDEVVEFNPATGNVQILRQRLPGPRQAPSALWLGDAVRVFGGSGSTDIVTWDPAASNRTIAMRGAGTGHYRLDLSVGQAPAGIDLDGGLPDAENQFPPRVYDWIPLNRWVTGHVSQSDWRDEYYIGPLPNVPPDNQTVITVIAVADHGSQLNLGLALLRYDLPIGASVVANTATQQSETGFGMGSVATLTYVVQPGPLGLKPYYIEVSNLNATAPPPGASTGYNQGPYHVMVMLSNQSDLADYQDGSLALQAPSVGHTAVGLPPGLHRGFFRDTGSGARPDHYAINLTDGQSLRVRAVFPKAAAFKEPLILYRLDGTTLTELSKSVCGANGCTDAVVGADGLRAGTYVVRALVERALPYYIYATVGDGHAPLASATLASDAAMAAVAPDSLKFVGASRHAASAVAERTFGASALQPLLPTRVVGAVRGTEYGRWTLTPILAPGGFQAPRGVIHEPSRGRLEVRVTGSDRAVAGVALPATLSGDFDASFRVRLEGFGNHSFGGEGQGPDVAIGLWGAPPATTTVEPKVAAMFRNFGPDGRPWFDLQFTGTSTRRDQSWTGGSASFASPGDVTLSTGAPRLMPATDYWVRIARSGSTLTVKAWNASSTEAGPTTTWTVVGASAQNFTHFGVETGERYAGQNTDIDENVTLAIDDLEVRDGSGTPIFADGFGPRPSTELAVGIEPGFRAATPVYGSSAWTYPSVAGMNGGSIVCERGSCDMALPRASSARVAVSLDGLAERGIAENGSQAWFDDLVVEQAPWALAAASRGHVSAVAIPAASSTGACADAAACFGPVDTALPGTNATAALTLAEARSRPGGARSLSLNLATGLSEAQRTATCRGTDCGWARAAAVLPVNVTPGLNTTVSAWFEDRVAFASGTSPVSYSIWVDDAATLSAGEAKTRATYVPTGAAPGWVQLTHRI
ncbi:MAG: Kelch repeat-containing protein, partial [Methanobacteriota archaeon]